MKIQIKQSAERAFTLVELLVVIVIIAVLSSLGFAVANTALQNARKVTALSAATNVANGVEQFYSEYNLLPDPTDGATEDNGASPFETATASGDGVALLNILAGYEDDSDDMQNDRRINMFSVKEAEKGNKGGAVYNGSGDNIKVAGLFDPWGQPYYIAVNYDYDNEMNIQISGPYSYQKVLHNRNVAVYSLGTDSPSDAERKHLVKTW